MVQIFAVWSGTIQTESESFEFILQVLSLEYLLNDFSANQLEENNVSLRLEVIEFDYGACDYDVRGSMKKYSDN